MVLDASALVNQIITLLGAGAIAYVGFVRKVDRLETSLTSLSKDFGELKGEFREMRTTVTTMAIAAARAEGPTPRQDPHP